MEKWKTPSCSSVAMSSLPVCRHLVQMRKMDTFVGLIEKTPSHRPHGVGDLSAHSVKEADPLTNRVSNRIQGLMVSF